VGKFHAAGSLAADGLEEYRKTARITAGRMSMPSISARAGGKAKDWTAAVPTRKKR